MAPAIKIDASKLKPRTRTGDREVFPFLYPTVCDGEPAPLLRLFLEAYEGPAGEPLKVEVYELDGYFEFDGKTGKRKTVREGSPDDLLATFLVTPVAAPNPEGRSWWEKPQPQGKTLDRAPERHVPYFRFTFAGKGDPKKEGAQKADPACPVFWIPLTQQAQESEGDAFEIGYIIKAPDGRILATLDCNPVRLYLPRCFTPPAHEHSLLSLDFALGASLEKALANEYRGQDRLTNPNLAQMVDQVKTRAEKRQKQYAEAAKQALKELDAHLEQSSRVYDIYVVKYREYLALLPHYLKLVEAYERGDEQEKQNLEQVLAERRINILERKKELDQYLSTTASIPRAYVEQADKVRKIRERNQVIDEFLDQPLIKVLCLLPGSGVVTGVLQMVQGKYMEGLISVGLDLASYGTWSKLERMADLYQAFGRYRQNGGSAVKALLEYRYMNAALTKAGQDGAETLAKLAMRVDPGFEKLYDTIKGFKELKDSGDAIAQLIKGRLNLIKAVNAAVRSTEISSAADFITFLRKAGLYYDFLLIAAALKRIKQINDQDENVKALANMATAQDEEEAIKSIQKAMQELMSLRKQSALLPSADKAIEAAEAVEGLIKYLAKTEILIRDVLEEIPNTDIEARLKEEQLQTNSKRLHLKGLVNLQFSHTQEQLFDMLAQVQQAFQEIIPQRSSQFRQWGESRNGYWDHKACQWENGIEELINKLTDELEGRSYLLGKEIALKSWFYGQSIQMGGRLRIYSEGFSCIGISLCESVIWEVS